MPERSALPQNYNKTAGTLWQGFETDSNWTCFEGSMENNTSQYHTGSQSLKLTASGVGGSVGIRRAISSIDLGSINKCIEIQIYIHDDPWTSIDYINLYLGTDSSNCYKVALHGLEFREGMWNRVLIPRSAWTQIGAGNWNDITDIEITMDCEAGESASISVDSMYYGLEQEGRIILSFDDGYESVYTEAYSYMSARGIKGTLYMIPVRMGVEGFLSSDNLDTLYDAGWDLANHTYNHLGNDGDFLTALSQAEIESELIQCQTWLEDRGYTKASRHVAYPGGKYNDAVFAAMTATGMLTGRVTSTSQLALPVGDFRFLRSKSLYNATSLATAKALIDRAVDEGTTEHFFTHALFEEAGGGSWSIADFQALIDYGEERRVRWATMTEWYEGLTNPRYETIPVVRSAR